MIRKLPIFLMLFVFCFAAPRSYAEGFFPFGGGSKEDASAGKKETVYTTTPDGWKIALTHISPAPGTKEHRYPVILCHGFGYNANYWMLDAVADLPNYLSQQGYDVWVPSLRGSGKSSKWMFKLAEVGGEAAGLAFGKNPKDDPLGTLFGAVKIVQGIGKSELNNASADPKYMNWTYDDYVMQDVPTIIKAVKEKSGKDKVHWVGHSMGGNIVLCYLTQTPKANEDVASLFTAGSQLTMSKGTVMRRQFENFQAQRLLEVRGNAGDLATMKEATKETNNKMFFNLDNADQVLVTRLNEIGLDTPSLGVLGQYMTLSDTGKYSSTDKKIDYTAGASNISVPAFFSAGGKDNFVNPDDVDFLIKHVSSSPKESKIYGHSQGFSVDFGHNDSFISSAASREIYPLVVGWLDANDGVKSPGKLKRKGAFPEF